jgi:hypothetical protein
MHLHSFENAQIIKELAKTHDVSKGIMTGHLFMLMFLMMQSRKRSRQEKTTRKSRSQTQPWKHPEQEESPSLAKRRRPLICSRVQQDTMKKR